MNTVVGLDGVGVEVGAGAGVGVEAEVGGGVGWLAGVVGVAVWGAVGCVFWEVLLLDG